MLASFTILAALGLGAPPALAPIAPIAPTVESAVHQVAPVPAGDPALVWTRTKPQAVVLLQGFHPHPLGINVAKAEFRGWQKSDAPLVKELAKNADVYVFAYGQNVSIDVIAGQSKLPDAVATLKRLGYDEVVLLGHSAGGLIARHFVEDFPDAGVTKVVQLACPNGGSGFANLVITKNQKPFAECLTEKHRQQCLLVDRAGKTIPAKIQFVCVVTKDGPKTVTDGIVKCDNQWTADLQAQGIPAYAVVSGHREAVYSAKNVETIARVCRLPQPRWPTDRIDQTRAEIFGPPPRPGLFAPRQP